MDYDIGFVYDETNSIWEVSVAGEIDIFNSGTFKQKLNELLEINNSDVRINCANLEYIDSTGLGALVAVLKQVKLANHNLYLKNVKSNILKLFKITDLDKVFIIEEVK